MIANSIQHSLRFLVSVMLCLNLVGCGFGASTSPTIAPTVIPQAPTIALTPSAPAVTATSVQAVPPPTPVPAAPTATLSPTTAPVPAGDLSAAEMRAIAEASLDAYPWRINQTALVKSSNYSITGLTEAAGREQVRALQNVKDGNVLRTIELVLITPTLYVKTTNAPPEELRAAGLTDGQWAKLTSGSAYSSYMYSVRNAANAISFIGIPDTVDQNLKIFRVVGTEQVSGRAATIYEYKTGDPSDPASGTTYRTSMGIQDRRIYKMVSDSTSQMISTTVEYVPGLKVEPPLP